MSDCGKNKKSGHVGMVYLLVSLAMVAMEWSFCAERPQAIEAESRAEKEANLNDQAQGGSV